MPALWLDSTAWRTVQWGAEGHQLLPLVGMGAIAGGCDVWSSLHFVSSPGHGWYCWALYTGEARALDTSGFLWEQMVLLAGNHEQ